MLKKFFLNSLSAFVGAWAAITLLIIAAVIFVFALIGSVANTSSGMKLTKKSILKISLQGEIIDYERKNNIDFYSLASGTINKPQSLHVLKSAIDNAAGNSNIDAIFIECGGVQAAPATLNALRNCLKEFKKSGKKIFAYGDYISLGDFLVASIADNLYLNPFGSMYLQGISGTVLYYKDLLDKIGISFEAVKVGTFKSAVEPYISNDMSEPARAQLDTLYTEMWSYLRQNIADSRKINSSTIDSLVNNFIFLDEASVAAEYHLVDGCKYQREIYTQLAEYLGVGKEDLNFVTPDFLVTSFDFNGVGKTGSIAVLFAEGEIGEYPGAGINCKEMVPLIVKLAENNDVKGLVLRVNSPGGSVFGSEQIGEALEYFKSKGKKLAVSMGSYAASGGYWISAGADRIYADPLTITGSIGIFGLVPNVEKLADMIGVHPQTVSTNPGVEFPSIFYPMTDPQRAALQKNIQSGYDKFIARVAKGRHKSEAYIRSIAEGRVWNAMRARELGLVDELGGLQNAIDWVAKAVNESDYEVSYYPAYQPNFMDMLQQMMNESNGMKSILANLKQREFDNEAVSLVVRLLSQKREQAIAPVVNFNYK